MAARIVVLGASTVDKDGVRTQASMPVGNDTDDVEPLGEVQHFGCLGVSAVPYPQDDNGHAEGVAMENCGGRDAVCVGARDTRTADTVGTPDPGDTILHSTGPSQSAQVQCKEKGRSVVIITKDESGEGLLFRLDGKEKCVQIMAFGGVFEMTPEGITISNGDASIVMQGKTIALAGDVIIGGLKPNPAMKFMIGPPSGQPPGPAAILLMPAMGVSPGV